MQREYHRWYSERLGREMELLVFGHAGAKVLVFPTRDRRFYEYEQLHMVQQIAHKLETGQLQLLGVDSIDKATYRALVNTVPIRLTLACCKRA